MTRNKITLGPTAADFIWAVGIEDTFVPQTRPGHRALDEYELVGHYEHWRQDLALTQELGVQAIRWGVPWYRVEPQQGKFDWSWTDEVLPYLVEELGVVPIVDLMHYGCPFWLEGAFDNPAYPEAVATYAAAFAARYHSLVKWYTPLNEAFINSLMCGKRGEWPPYLRGDKGFVRLMLQLARGIHRTVNAIKAIDSNAMMVHVEAAGLRRIAHDDLSVLALEDKHRGYLSLDLLSGRVTRDHMLFGWLLRHGANPAELAALVRDKIALDVIGLNFYPQWSTRQMHIDRKGRLAYRLVEKDGIGFIHLLEDYYERYRVPMIVTETSAFGAHKVRSRWLDASVAAIKILRERGIPIHGYTWFPLFTMYKWSYRRGKLPADRYRFELGLYQLSKPPEEPRFIKTPLIEQFAHYVRAPALAVGDIAPVPDAQANPIQ